MGADSVPMGPSPRALLVCALALAATSGLARATCPRSQDASIALQSEHYDLQVQGTPGQAGELQRVLELTWPVLAGHFQAQPRLSKGERLRVRVYADREAWLAGLGAENTAPPQGLDLLWYRPESATVHLYLQESAYLTRGLLIQGACQQFFERAKAKNVDLTHSWFVRGMGEHLGHHRWDGTRLELGARLHFDSKDFARRAIRAWEPRGWGIADLQEQELAAPEVAWSLVRFLLEGEEGKYRKRFEKLALGSKGSKLTGAEYARALGDARTLSRELAAWLGRTTPTWSVLAGDWEEPEAGRVSAAPLGGQWALALAPAGALQVRVELVLSAGQSAGLVIERREDGAVTTALVQEGRIEVLRVAGERKEALLSQELPNLRLERNALVLIAADDTRSLSVDGSEVFRLDAARGEMGLCVARGKVELLGVGVDPGK